MEEFKMASAEEVLKKKRDFVDTEDGRFAIRRVHVVELIAAGLRVPFGEKTAAAAGQLPQKQLSEEAKAKSKKEDAKQYGVYCQTLVKEGVISPRIVVGSLAEFPTSIALDQINTKDLEENTLFKLILGVEKLSGFSAHSRGKEGPEGPGGFSSEGVPGPVEDGSQAGPDPVESDRGA